MPRSSHSGRGVAAKDGCQLPDDARRACVRAAETECSFADAVLRLAYGGPTKAASAPPLFDPQGWREGKWPPQVAEAVWTLCAAIQQGRVPAGAHGFPIDAKQWARQSELEGYRVFAREPGQLIARVEFETRGMLVAVAGLELAFPAAAEPAPEQSEPAPPQEDTPHLPEEDALDPLGPAPAPQKGAKPTEPPKTAAATIATIKIGVTTKQRVEDYLNKNCVDPKTPGLAEAISRRSVCTLDALLEIRPPFDPEQAVARCAALLRRYQVATVSGDKYAGEWPRARFAEHGITFEQSARPKSDLYGDLLPL